MKVKVRTDELHPEGWHRFCIRGVKIEEGAFGPQFAFDLESAERDTSGQRFELRAWANTKLSEKSKLGAIVMACGFDLPKAGEEFDLEELLGSVVEGLVEHVERERGTFVSVSKFRPRRSNSGSAPRIGSDRSDPFSDE